MSEKSFDSESNSDLRVSMMLEATLRERAHDTLELLELDATHSSSSLSLSLSCSRSRSRLSLSPFVKWKHFILMIQLNQLTTTRGMK